MRLLLYSVSAVLLLGVLVAIALKLLLAIVFWEPDRAERGSLAYLLAIPSVAKGFPLWRACGPIFYSYRFQDGLSPETYWIDYQTRLSGAALRSKLLAHASASNCDLLDQPATKARRTNSEPIIACRGDRREIRVTTDAGRSATTPGCRRVTILFVEDL